MKVVYRIDWTESERGWGQRPDGTTMYPTLELAKAHVEDYWAWYMKEYGTKTPHEYSFPSEPYLFELKDEKLFEEVQEKGKVWAHARYYRVD